MISRSRKKFLFLAIAGIVVAPVILSSTLRRRLILHSPLKGPYLRYSKWRYDWRSPSDLGDGRNALQVIIESPMGLAADSSDNLYVSDRTSRLIWKIEPSGRATVIAGTGKSTGPEGLPRERVPALDVDFASPEGVAVDQDGNILIADSLNHAILKIDREGYLTRIAGNGQRGFNGDGIPATEASLSAPYDVRVDSQGQIYIADVFNQRVRKIDGNGVISTVAGTGMAGYSGDGGPAIHAQLNMPYGILPDVDGNLFIADSDNNVVRKIGPDGIIHTIAGNGQRGYEGDGNASAAAKLDSPQALAMDRQGRIYIDDEHNNAIRFVERDGTMHTLVGSKGPGFSGDGGPASLAQIADPENVLVRRDGSILICARDNARLRIVSPEGIINTFAGKGPTSSHDYYAPITLPTVEP